MEVRFAEEYLTKTEDELVRLWQDRESLLPEAFDALSAEIQRRELDIDIEVQTLAKLTKIIERRETQHRLRTIPQGYQPAGYGVIGRANLELDEETGHEEFDTIVFVFFLFFPVYPSAAYRIEKSRNVDLRWRMLEPVPIPWNEVRLIWARAAFVAALAFFVLTVALTPLLRVIFVGVRSFLYYVRW